VWFSVRINGGFCGGGGASVCGGACGG